MDVLSTMISRRAQSMPESGIRRIFEMVSGMENPVNLSIGQPHFDVPQEVREAAAAAIQEGHNRYTVTQGLPELNDRVCTYIQDKTGYQAPSSLITGGVSGGLLLGMLASLDPGDEILIPDPYFTMYAVLAGVCGAQWVTYDLYPGVALTESSLEEGITERTRAILVNSPSNPTGRTLNAAEMEAVSNVAERHDLLVISDEIYEAFVYDGPFVSAGQYVDPDRLLLLGGFSKTWGMPGWRMGWALGPGSLVDAMRRFQQFSFVCAPTPFQHAALKALDCDMTEQIAAYQQKRDRIVDGIGAHYDVSRPQGAFYCWPALPPGIQADHFLQAALEQNLLIVPGSAFSPRQTHFRLSFAAQDDTLDRGVEILVKLAEDLTQG